MTLTFFLGTHQPHWLADVRFADVPLFVSRRALRSRRLPRAVGAWSLDSGGFTELAMHGQWTIPPAQYVAEVRRFRDEIGQLRWAAPQDWMCEPHMLARTGLTVEEHQRRTVENFLALRSLAPELPFVPVVQGWTEGDYWRCVELYAAHGVDLAAQPVVGIGTVCRRQGTTRAAQIITGLADAGLRLHGFGYKIRGLQMVGGPGGLVSADSLAWSYRARREAPLPGHATPGPGRRTGHKNCANCAEFALLWREEVLASLGRERQQVLPLRCA